jgi:hypothetical protein
MSRHAAHKLQYYFVLNALLAQTGHQAIPCALGGHADSLEIEPAH